MTQIDPKQTFAAKAFGTSGEGAITQAQGGRHRIINVWRSTYSVRPFSKWSVGDTFRASATISLTLGLSGGGSSRSAAQERSEEHTSELQSRQYLVCRLLLEKKKKKIVT